MADNERNWWFELAWKADRDSSSTFDLQDFVHGVMEQAKANLADDAYLASAAWIIEPVAIHCFDLGFKELEHKYEVYDLLAKKAKELRADAVVMLNDAYWSDDLDPSTYYQGKFAEEGKQCIWVSVTAPDKPSWSLQTKYRCIDDKYVFDPTERLDDEKVGLLGSWSKEMREIQ